MVGSGGGSARDIQCHLSVQPKRLLEQRGSYYGAGSLVLGDPDSEVVSEPGVAVAFFL